MRKQKSEEVVEIKAFRDGVTYPTKSTTNAAGYDVYAWCLDCYGGELLVTANDTKLIKTGLNVNIPKGYEVQVRSRSGLAAKNAVVVLNSPGTIDCDFTGEGENFEVKQLSFAGIVYDQLVMGIGGGSRVLINDLRANGDQSAFVYQPKRNEGIGGIQI